jgi:DNA-binding MarR family transcriptional regulator
MEANDVMNSELRIPRALAESPLYMLRRALRIYTAEWHRLYGALTPPQCAVLLTLRENPGLTQSQMGDLTGIDLATLTPLLRGLEERGQLTRLTAPDNRRRKVLQLTKEGAELVDFISKSSASLDEAVLGDLPQEHRDALMSALTHIAGRS